MEIRAFFENVLKKSAGEDASIAGFLKKTLLFRHLSHNECHALEMLLHERRYGEGEVVFKEGEEGAAMYVIRSGAVRVVKGGELLVRLEAGDFFGEMSLFSELKRSATIEAAVDGTMLLALSKGNLEDLMNRSPRLANKIIVRITEVLVNRLEQMNVRITDMHKAHRKKDTAQP